MGGVYGSVSLTAGEGADTSATQRSTSARLGYKSKAFDVSGAYGQFGSTNKLKITALGANYDLGGGAKVEFGYGSDVNGAGDDQWSLGIGMSF